MTATKTNERPGTRAQARYVRMSPYKARVVLDIIRGLEVAAAEDVLINTERSAADVILKTMQSAVANAGHNDSIPPEELFVSACYADEGPTLKRWRPRASGRATRIRKRTCHITIIVSRLEGAALDRLRERQAGDYTGKGASDAPSSDDRRRRVAKSKAADEAASEAAAGAENEETEETEEISPETAAPEATEELLDDDAENAEDADDASGEEA